jgi:hypothetical protein
MAQLAVLFQLARSHAGVAIHFAIVAKSFLLTFPSSHDSLANSCGTFFSAFAGDISVFHGRHFNVQIDAIK